VDEAGLERAGGGHRPQHGRDLHEVGPGPGHEVDESHSARPRQHLDVALQRGAQPVALHDLVDPPGGHTDPLRQARASLLDLEDVYFVEIPWLADPDGAAFAGISRRDYPNAAFERLYALGIDAFRVAQAFARDVPPERLELDGATGHLSLDASHQFVREAMLMQFRGGLIVPAGGR